MTKNLKQAAIAINKIAKFNKVKNYKKVTEKELDSQAHNQLQKYYSLADMFRYKSMLKLSLLMIPLSIAPNIQYFGIQFAAVSLGYSFGVNSFFMGLAEILSNILLSRLPIVFLD